MKLNISTILTVLGTATTALVGYPTWLLWVLGVASAVLSGIIAIRSLWRWYRVAGEDVEVDGAIAEGIRSLVARVGSTQSATAVERLTDSVVKLVDLRNDLRKR